MRRSRKRRNQWPRERLRRLEKHLVKQKLNVWAAICPGVKTTALTVKTNGYSATNAVVGFTQSAVTYNFWLGLARDHFCALNADQSDAKLFFKISMGWGTVDSIVGVSSGDWFLYLR